MSVASTLASAVEPLRADPARAAVLLDVDGTLAPIVRHADDALLVGLPAVGGVLAGTWLQQRVPPRAVSLLFAALLAATAVELLIP